MIEDALIRLAHPGDARAIAEIHVDTWRVVYQKLISKAYLSQMTYDRTARSVFSALLDPRAVYLIAEKQQGVAIGYICGGPARSDNRIYHGEVYELYITPAYQRQGIGRRLLSALANRLYRRNFYSLMVWVLARNPNRRFYEKTGGLLWGAKTIAFADKKLQAVAYGWIDITLALMSGKP